MTRKRQYFSIDANFVFNEDSILKSEMLTWTLQGKIGIQENIITSIFLHAVSALAKRNKHFTFVLKQTD